jgi:3-phenylpropionate/trans-cinnamate dioxygenase ferredoxin reductase subunit
VERSDAADRCRRGGSGRGVLRRQAAGRGFTGAITLIGEEHAPPYQRPPLSKAYLLGDMALERLYLRPESYYAENGIELMLDTTVQAIDRSDQRSSPRVRRSPTTPWSLRRVRCRAACRGPSAESLDGVHVVRTLKDVDEMAPEIVQDRRALIVGGGYIGLEAAAVCRKKGLDVTLIEMADRILARVACPETSAWFRDLHERHGVTVLEGVGLTCLNGVDGKVVGAILSDMTEHPYDVVIAGIGITPASALAEAAGLEVENGIKVDAQGRTSDPAIWAAGDCASFPYRGERIRLESVQNAIDQAEAVAKNMLGADEDYVPHPWFWSDQYDVKLQIAGLNTGYTDVVVRDSRRGAVALVLRGRHAPVGRRDERSARLHGRQAPDRDGQVALAGGRCRSRDRPQGAVARMRDD